MKYKKTIAIALCVGLILSSIGPVLADINLEDIANLKIPFSENKGTEKSEDSHNAVKSDINKPEPENPVLYVNELLPDENQGVLYKGEKEQPGVEDPTVDDRYNINGDEIEELLSKGNSVEDIFKADEIGNEINEDPKRILERKTESKKDLLTIKEDILKEKRTSLVKKLADRHSEEYQQMKSESLDEGSQLVLLAFLENNEIKSIKDLIKDYKADGQTALEKHKNKKADPALKEKMSTHSLSEVDVEGISGEKLSKMEEFCQKNNIDMEQMIKGLKTQKEKMKGVITQ